MKKIVLRTIVISSVIAMAIHFNAGKKPTEWSEYVVGVGDTVYGISMSVTPNNEDYRETEYWITKKNNIEQAMIYPGQAILVPVYE